MASRVSMASREMRMDPSSRNSNELDRTLCFLSKPPGPTYQGTGGPMHYVKGRTTRQAHVDIPEGTVEEEYARRGFFGRVSHMYRTQPPVNWVRLEGDLRPHSFATDELPGQGGDWLQGRVAFLYNADVT